MLMILRVLTFPDHSLVRLQLFAEKQYDLQRTEDEILQVLYHTV